MTVLPVKLDFLFKLLFGDERNTEILANFLSAVLEKQPDELAEIQLLDTALKKEHDDDKQGILDVNLKTKSGIRINIEVQIINKGDFEKRAVFYTGKRLIGQLGEGDPYKKLNQTISINIIDYNMFEYTKYHSIFMLTEQTEHIMLTDVVRIDFLELQKARVAPKNSVKELWMDFFNAESEEELAVLAQKDQVFKKPVAEVLRLSSDKDVRDMYEIRQRYLRDRMAEIEYGERQGLEKGLAKGMANGLAKGMAQGMAKGMAEGLVQGRAEGEQKGILAVASNMKRLGIPPAQIAKATGLADEEINALS